MITPFFTISQDAEFVYIDVKVTHMRFSAQNLEMVVQQELFVFLLNPYYLRLRFPHACVDDERSSAHYDSKAECVKIKIPKEIKGQEFPDLDLTAKLLARSEQPKKPLIEEVETSEPTVAAEGEHFNWEIAQDVPSELPASLQVTYGFNGSYSGMLGVSLSNGNDINELSDPEAVAASDRVMERLIKENIKFDPEYYAADYIMEKYPSPDDDKRFKELLEWRAPSTKTFLKWYKKQQLLPEAEREQFVSVDFTSKEQEQMLQLPRKSYLLDDTARTQAMLMVVSVLFAYHYDLRENEGDSNIESAWTVGRLTPQIAFLDSQLVQSGQPALLLQLALITGTRRALSYPLHRNYALVQKAWDDVYYNLRGGKRLVVQTLLAIRELFRYHDIYYVYDKIWFEDLCSWIIADVADLTLRTLAHDVRKEHATITRELITFEKLEGDDIVPLTLAEIEQMAETSYQEYINA